MLELETERETTLLIRAGSYRTHLRGIEAGSAHGRLGRDGYLANDGSGRGVVGYARIDGDTRSGADGDGRRASSDQCGCSSHEDNLSTGF